MERRIDYWAERWTTNDSPWHKSQPHKFLVNNVKHFSELGHSPVKILVPLCGKSIDLLWLYDQGFHVIGVEGVLKPIQEFFSEHNLEYLHGNEAELPYYMSKDERLKIYHCDLFELKPSISGHFHGVWDRGSLVAIPSQDRIRYGQLMKNLLHSNFVYLLDTMDYEQSLYPGPPLSVPASAVQQIFGDCSLEELERIDKNADASSSLVRPQWKVGECFELCLLLRPNGTC